MKPGRFFLLVSAIVALAANLAFAKDDPLEFLHLMQKEGFPDVAIDYLNSIKDDPNPPPEIMRVWDLEMSKSKREKVKIAYDAAEAKQLNEEAKALMEKFIKENPNQPEAIQAAAEWATEKAIQAQYDVAVALDMSDQAQRKAAMDAAHKKFEEIRPQFVQARDSSEKVYAALTAKASRRQKENAFLQAGDNKLNVGMIDFYLALTMENGPQRDAAFSKLAKELDAIYHEYSNQEVDYYVGWKAHFWNARILQEQGKYQDACDIYEEVTVHDVADVVDSANVSANPSVAQRFKRKTGLEDFFADVEQQYLRVLFQVSRADYTKEFLAWRASHKVNSLTCAGYQGLTYDYAHNLYDISKDAKNAAKSDTLKHEAVKLLGEVARTPGPYQGMAVKLRREIDPNAGNADSFEDRLIDAYAAAEKKDYASAADLFLGALKAATDKTDKKKLAEVRNVYVQCVHNEAMELYKAKKVDDAVALIVQMLKTPEFRETAAAPAAAVFALTIQYYELLAAPDKTEAEKTAREAIVAKVAALAKGIVSTREWTAKEQADSARIILLRIALDKCDRAEDAAKEAAAKGKKDDATRLLSEAKAHVAEADDIFKGINTVSHEYPKALTVLGFEHWRRYRNAKRDWDHLNNGAAPDKELQAQLDDDRSQAVGYTQKAVEALSVPRAAGTPMSKELRDTSVLLAEMYAEGNDFKKAVPIYQGLADDILKDPATKSLDDTTLQVFNGAVQAYLQLNDLAKASVIASKVLEMGADDGPVNMSIINFAKRLEIVRKQLADEGEATGEAAVKQQAIVDLETKIMVEMSKRDKFTSENNPAPIKVQATTMVWIVKTLSLLNRDEADDAATKLVEKIFDMANNNPDFDQQVGKAKAGLRATAANLLAKHGQYEKAVEEAKGLIDQYPKALEPQMTKAEIYTKWAAKDPAKYNEAISIWDTLANKLERVPAKSGKPGDKMPEYYVARYNEYLCFFKSAEKDNDKPRGRQVFELISPMLQFDPKIQGPDRDRELSYRFYQLAGKIADFIGVERPQPPKAQKKK